jgi:hypothetical protein
MLAKLLFVNVVLTFIQVSMLVVVAMTHFLLYQQEQLNSVHAEAVA